jgi:hypothetical protein
MAPRRRGPPPPLARPPARGPHLLVPRQPLRPHALHHGERLRHAQLPAQAQHQRRRRRQRRLGPRGAGRAGRLAALRAAARNAHLAVHRERELDVALFERQCHHQLRVGRVGRVAAAGVAGAGLQQQVERLHGRLGGGDAAQERRVAGDPALARPALGRGWLLLLLLLLPLRLLLLRLLARRGRGRGAAPRGGAAADRRIGRGRLRAGGGGSAWACVPPVPPSNCDPRWAVSPRPTCTTVRLDGLVTTDRVQPPENELALTLISAQPAAARGLGVQAWLGRRGLEVRELWPAQAGRCSSGYKRSNFSRAGHRSGGDLASRPRKTRYPCQSDEACG